MHLREVVTELDHIRQMRGNELTPYHPVFGLHTLRSIPRNVIDSNTTRVDINS